jgi:hypothetical protein
LGGWVLTRSVAFASIYNTALRYSEEFESLDPADKVRKGEEFFEQFVAEILDVCYDADEV